jgi:hypothetical protein
VLVTSNGLRLIDWDRLQRADPARDIAYIGTSWWVWLLRQKRTPDWSVLEQAVSAYDSLRPGARIQARLPFHLAAGLLRHAHALVELWPEDAYLVPELTAEAHRRLQRS